METKLVHYEHFGPFGTPAQLPLAVGAAKKKTFDSIPVIDLRRIYSPSLAERKALAKELGQACRDVGFFYASAHGVDPRVASEAFRAIQDFFALDNETKMAVHFHKSAGFRGYEPLFETRHEAHGQGDMKEAFSFSHESDEGLEIPNQWPANQPQFRNALTTYVNAVELLAQRLMGIFALALDLPEDYFTTTYPRSGAGIRALYYPPQPVQDAAALEVGIGAHTDYSWFSLINQSAVGGLEIQNANGEWVPATPIEGTFVVNIGDSLQWVSGGRFLSTRHRVVNRVAGRARHSLAFFKSPHVDSVLQVAPTCRTGKNPQENAGLVMREYGRMRRTGSRQKHPLIMAAQSMALTEKGTQHGTGSSGLALSKL
ncbi:Clavaminate synthase-like protein [Xylaria intraflava]|nr:Clavaminate synthase-like protein [Xylaria intraflava]